MKNVFDLIGDVVDFGTGEEYYICDCKQKGSDYILYSLIANAQSSGKKEQLIIMGYRDGELKGALYDGEDYQSILSEFNSNDNLRNYLQFLDIQKHVLLNESK